MITKNKLVELLAVKKEEDKNCSTDFYFRGDYHDIGLSELSDIVEMLDDATEFDDYDAIVEALQYNGSISEYADSSTPIYYNQIAKWFGENWSAVDECLDELGSPAQDERGRSDIMKTIQMSYCWSYERDIQSALEALVDDLPEEEEEEQAEEATKA